jgi:hypothetical protein
MVMRVNKIIRLIRVLAVLIIGGVTITSCSKNAIRGSGTTLTENRTVSSFSAVQLEGSGNVNIVQGAQQKVEVTGFENLLPIYETSVQNGTLVLKFNSEYHNISNNNIMVNITIPALSRIGINGSGVYRIKNLQGSTFDAEINGSGDIFSENCSYNSAYLKVNGSGYLRAAGIASNVVEALISGSGKIDVTSSQKLKATISGSGEINYWGNPQDVTSEISGSGKVRKR